MPPRNPPPRADKSGEENRRRTIQRKVARMEEGPPAVPLASGFAELDAALGGGFPRGRIVEIFGPPASGKTTLALHIAAHLQKVGKMAGWIDADCTFDPAYAAATGVDLEGFPVVRPESAENAMGMVESLAESGALDLIVVDPVAALAPSLELEAGVGSQSPGLYARVLGSGLRTLARVAARRGATLLMLNQSLESSGGSAGGAPLKLYAWVRIGLYTAGGRVRFRTVKNKAGGGLTQGEILWKS